MKKIYVFITAIFIGSSILHTMNAKQQTNNLSSTFGQQKKAEANFSPYVSGTFTAENQATGYFWAGDGTEKYPGKAFLGEIEYSHVIALEKTKINTKVTKKLRKNKQYLGSYIDQKSGTIWYVYGMKKIPDIIDNSPDADVLTQIAIKEDYGPGE